LQLPEMLEFLQHLQVHRVVFLRSVERKDTDAFFPSAYSRFHRLHCHLSYSMASAFIHLISCRAHPRSGFVPCFIIQFQMQRYTSCVLFFDYAVQDGIYDSISMLDQIFRASHLRHRVQRCSIVPRMIALSRYGPCAFKSTSSMPSLMQSSKISAPFLIILKASVDRIPTGL